MKAFTGILSKDQRKTCPVGDGNKLPLPFVLRNMEERIGAVSPTTSGTYDDVDGADYS